jgi:hypothetical protein
MSRSIANLLRKILSLALIFNSLLCLISLAEVLAACYATGYSWDPYSPYLIDGSLFWFAVLTVILNIVPAKSIGRVHVRRLLFHHYVYGFVVMIFGSVLLFSFSMPGSILASSGLLSTTERIGYQSITFYTYLFLLYGGLTLFLDDFADISLKTRRILDGVRERVFRSGGTIRSIHFLSSLITLYLSISVFLWFIERQHWIAQWPIWFLAHVFFISSLLVNSFWGLNVVMKRLWSSCPF